MTFKVVLVICQIIYLGILYKIFFPQVHTEPINRVFSMWVVFLLQKTTKIDEATKSAPMISFHSLLLSIFLTERCGSVHILYHLAIKCKPDEKTHTSAIILLLNWTLFSASELTLSCNTVKSVDRYWIAILYHMNKSNRVDTEASLYLANQTAVSWTANSTCQQPSWQQHASNSLRCFKIFCIVFLHLVKFNRQYSNII